MLPKFLNDLRQDLVEVTLELDDDADEIVVCSVAPAPPTATNDGSSSASEPAVNGILRRSLSATSRSIRKTFGWLRSASTRTTASNSESVEFTLSAREARRLKAKLQRTRSSARRALDGLRFISKTTVGGNGAEELWKQVEARFELLAKEGLLARKDFGECIGKTEKSRTSSTLTIFSVWLLRKLQGKFVTKYLYICRDGGLGGVCGGDI